VTEAKDERPRPADPLGRLIFSAPAVAFLNYTIAFVLVGSAVFVISLSIFAPDQAVRAFGPALMSLVAVIAKVLLARGRIEAAVNMIAFGLWVVVTGIAFFTGGVRGMAIIVYPQLILLVGWLIGTRAAVTMAMLAVAATFGFALAESWDVLPLAPATPPVMRWIVQSFIFAFSVILIVSFVRSYRERLVDADKLGRDLVLRSAEVQAREADLNRAQEVAHVGSWVYDLSTDLIRLSAETCRIFGLPEGTTGSRDSYLSRVHAGDRGAVDRAWQAAIEGGASFDHEHRIVVGKAVHWVRQKAELERDVDGTPLRSVGTTQDITERKHVEAALQESEQRFRDLLQYVPSVAVQGYGLDGTTQYWNQASERLYGYSAQEAIGQNLLELIIPPEMRGGVEQAIRQMAETGQPIPSAELSLQRKDGSRVAVFSSHALVRIPGRATELFCIDIDLTERKRYEAEILAARNQLNATLDAIPDLLFEVGLDGHYYDYHSPRADLLAAPAEELVGRTISEFLPREAAAVALAALREANEKGRSHGRQFELPLPQGRRWFELSVSRKPIEPGAEPRFIALSRDITDRKHAEEELKKRNAFVESLLENAPIGFAVNTIDDGRPVFVGRNFEKIYGVAADSVRNTADFFEKVYLDPVQREQMRERIMADMASGDPARMHWENIPLRTQAGEYKVVTATNIPLPEQNLMISTVQDVTEKRRIEAAHDELEAQLRESQKMEALGTLAGGVAHDFNNIVAAIMGNVELACQDVGPGHAALESLEEIRKASRRAKDMVQQILAFGRRQMLERRVISLAPAVEESARLLRATLPAGVSLSVECAPDAPAVLADATQVEQVLLNLCANSWQAMQAWERPGAIEIRLEPYDHAPGAARSAAGRDLRGELRPGSYACLTVRDNGPGMAPETRARIFEPFFTTKPVGKGTGLGLAVVHGVVQEHGASIEIESVPGEGATFRIYFPAADVSVPIVATQAPDGAPAHGQGRRILYVDDDEAIVFLMTRLLERQGYRVSGYTDPQAALAAVRAEPQAFDLVVTDYNMPGLSGLEVARALQEIRADLPVALASGYITEELRAQAPAAGVLELVYKPNTVEELCEVVARLAKAPRVGTHLT
jgi:PAS domain S-box-containing protein